MGGARPNSTEQKLDMALDDLVDRKANEDKRSGGYGPAGQVGRHVHSDRDEPYAHRDGKAGGGKGKGKRLPPEDKALLKTQCFFNSAGELIVRLYDTEVFILKKRQGDTSGTKPQAANEETKVEVKPEGAANATDSLVLVLTSGGFRTTETRSILNEALHPLSMRINGSDSSRWTLCSDFKTPGQVTESSSSKPFEDGMQINLPSLVAPADVKQHLVMKIQAAKAAMDAPRLRTHEQGPPPPPPGSWGAPPPSYPLGWGLPPPGWGWAPPPYGGPCSLSGKGPAVSKGGKGGGKEPSGAPQPAKTGPVTDDMFQ